ncbi:MAG: glycosyltransferase family 2 protein [Verrucomicrobia bacterium]|nr:glycosyltransferase family 2 protein [Verrucomicrobiota bacterium]
MFWLSLAVLFYTFLGYPLLLFVLASLRDSCPTSAVPAPPPAITVVLAVHNEAVRIGPRLQNLLASDYPPGKLGIIVVSDGSTDATVQQIQALADPRVTLINQPQRQGKAHALNLALAAAKGEIIVFADGRQQFAPDTIAQLAKHFGDLQTGAVSGELIIASAASAAGSGVDTYWRLEKILRRSEARWDSSIGCTGAVYAIRRALYQPIPGDTILDDVVIPMQIALQGYRVAFEPAARAFDPQTLEPAREQIRKRRTLAGNYQMLFRHPAWLLPWRNRLWWQLISHKYLRLAAPLFLFLLFTANLLLLPCKLFWWPLLGQTLFYALALYGLTHPENKKRCLAIPAGFVFLNWMSAQSLWHYLRQPRFSGWQTT